MSETAKFDLPSETEPSNWLYRAIWRWHFYAGLFVIPFMLLLAITGSIYLFKPQLDAVMYPDRLFVQPATTVQPASEQIKAVQSRYPDATITKIAPAIAPDLSAEISLTTKDEQNLTAFVNPYTAQVLGDRNEDNNFQAIVRKIHGELMIGKTGDYLVELASCWGLVLLVSGLYLWFPRNGMRIGGTLIPRFWSRNRRIFWRDLHAVPGFYGVLLIAFLILTGLPWAGFWGETFARVWDRFPTYVFSEVPESTALTGTLNQHGTQTVPWAVEKLPMPQSGSQSQSDHAKHSGNHANSMPAATDRSVGLPVTIDSVVAYANANGVAPGYSVSVPQDKTGVYTVSVFPNDPAGERTMHIDQYSGKVLADVGFQDYALFPKAVELGVAIHMGKYFGIANQLLMLLACLIVILLCVSGAVMWWQRRPAGRLGAPMMPPYSPGWKIPLAIVAVMGLLFPLVGISLVAVLLLDYVIIARIPPLKRILS